MSLSAIFCAMLTAATAGGPDAGANDRHANPPKSITVRHNTVTYTFVAASATNPGRVVRRGDGGARVYPLPSELNAPAPTAQSTVAYRRAYERVFGDDTDPNRILSMYGVSEWRRGWQLARYTWAVDQLLASDPSPALARR